MNGFLRFARSSVGRKVLTGATGLGLVAFVTIHLIGNFTLLMGPEAFNGYAYFLEHLAHGMFVIVAELGLAAFFAIHAFNAIQVHLGKKKARSTPYAIQGDAGGPSRKSIASMTMIISGPLLLIFVIYHVFHFKLGPGMEDNAKYIFLYHGKEIRNLYLLVVEQFQNPLIVLIYVVAMAALGLHLVHGIWSALQSLGAANRKFLPMLVCFSLVLGILLAAGFIYIPIHTWLFLDPDTTVQTLIHSSQGASL